MKKVGVLFLLLTCYFTSVEAQTEIASRTRVWLSKDSLFIDFFTKFKKYVAENDSIKLEKLLNLKYGEANINIGKKNQHVKKQFFKIINRHQFMALYSTLFDRRMKSLIKNSSIEDCEITPLGVRFNRGQVWWIYYSKKKLIYTRAISNTDLIFAPLRN